jgi:hypothetical protein
VHDGVAPVTHFLLYTPQGSLILVLVGCAIVAVVVWSMVRIAVAVVVVGAWLLLRPPAADRMTARSSIRRSASTASSPDRPIGRRRKQA